MGNLVTQWAAAFKALYPNVQVDVEAKGSATAPPALIEGVSQIGPMSRPMEMGEIEAFSKKYGYPRRRSRSRSMRSLSTSTRRIPLNA